MFPGPSVWVKSKPLSVCTGQALRGLALASRPPQPGCTCVSPDVFVPLLGLFSLPGVLACLHPHLGGTCSFVKTWLRRHLFYETSLNYLFPPESMTSFIWGLHIPYVYKIHLYYVTAQIAFHYSDLLQVRDPLDKGCTSVFLVLNCPQTWVFFWLEMLTK